jgi:hypothetical protein
VLGHTASRVWLLQGCVTVGPVGLVFMMWISVGAYNLPGMVTSGMCYRWSFIFMMWISVGAYNLPGMVTSGMCYRWSLYLWCGLVLGHM